MSAYASQSTDSRRSHASVIVVALAATAMAALLRAWLSDSLGMSLPYVTFFASVIISAWFGGWLGGLIGTGAAAVAARYWFIAPSHEWRFATVGDGIGASVFVAECILMTGIIATLNRVRTRVAEQNDMLRAECAARELTERTAQTHAEELRATLMSISDAVIVTDAAARVRSMNPTAQDLTGWSGEDATTRDIEEVLRLRDERSERTLPSPARRALLDHEVFRLDHSTVLLRRDDVPVPVEATASPIHDADGTVTGSVVVLHDVSERRVARDALRESERELAHFFDDANVGLHWIGPDGIIVRANREELRMLGYAASEYVGHHIAEFHHDRRVADRILATLHTGERLQGCAARLRCADGSLKDVTINSSMRMGADGVRHVRAVTLDITERVAADRSRALLAAVVESSEDAIVTKGLDGVVTTWNAGAERLFGYSAEEAVGQHITFIIPVDHHSEEQSILARIGRGEKVPAVETIRVRKGGQLVTVSLSVSPVRDSAGRVIGASKVARDLSERVAMELALREAYRRKDEFLATLAHELRNPLAPMRHGLHLLTAPGADAGRLQKVTGILSRQLDHMVRLIDDLLDLSRVDRDKLDIKRAQVSLEAVVRQAVETARPLIDQSSHELVVQLPDEAIYLDGDAVRLAQVLTNLLSNAAKFTDPGGLIILSAERVNATLHLFVRDTGIGIARDNIERVFEMFSQGHSRPEESRGGLGIGLTLVRRIVELHGGRVTLESEGLGTGTTAHVTLPLGPPGEPDGARPSDALSAVLMGRRVLVADDNRDSADTLGMLLTLRGAEAVTAYDGEEAVARFQSDRPDIVLLDLGMPRLGGLDACRAMRQLPRGRDAIIVALTGWGQEQDRHRSLEAGFDGHLVKPVDLPVLIELLRDRYANRSANVR
jgi:PAS domain S-box-containing protein